MDTLADARPVAAPPITGGAGLPLALCLFLGLGGLATGAIGPLYSTFVPPMARAAVADDRIVGLILAIDNVLLFLLVPWTGALSDRRLAAGRTRRPLVVGGLVVAAAGMVMLYASPAFGLAGLLGALVVLNIGHYTVRAPFHALIADLVPSRYRSFATGAMTAFMCLGAIVFLGLASVRRSPEAAFLASAATLLAVALAFAGRLREPAAHGAGAAETTFGLLRTAAAQALGGTFEGMRAAFVSLLFIHLSFQTFASWFTLHAGERFGVAPSDAAVGFIVWAVGGLLGSLPAGMIGIRIGRRNAMLVGLAGMALSLVALDRVPTLLAALPLVFVASACWSMPTVNAFPLLVEPFPRARRGVLAALFFICMALGGILGDPFNGWLFERAGTRRFLFLAMALYTALAFVAVLWIPRGAGEADARRSGRPSA